MTAAGGAVEAAETAALYEARWAGLPAAQIRLAFSDTADSYRNEIAITAEGLARLFTHFRGTAAAEGRLARDRLPAPLHFDAHYDLRKRRDRRLSMRFLARGGAVFADRGAGDTSRKPPLPAAFRRDVVDPLSAVTAIRDRLRRDRRAAFTVPVYDGARRFDVNVRILPKTSAADPRLHLALSLRPIAGFKGETSEDGDPDDSPRPVALTMTDDARLMPLAMRVSIYYLPLTVELTQWCSAGARCGW